MVHKLIEVAIVGGGPAGLSAALTLGRARRSTVIIDHHKPRNKMVRHSHGFLTRDGLSPREFRELAKEELKKYPSVRFINDEVVDVRRNHKIFQVTTKNGVLETKKMLFATGLVDVLPEIDGFDAVYGISAFICPYCDGWEFRDKPIAIIGHQLADFHFVKALYGWSHDVALFTNGKYNLDDSLRQAFQQKNIPVFEEKIHKLWHSDGQLQAIELESGQTVARSGIFFNPKTQQSSLIPKKLGVPMDQLGQFITKEDGKTNIDGLYIAGDSRNHLHQIIHAASDGAKAAVSINMELLKEAWDEVGL